MRRITLMMMALCLSWTGLTGLALAQPAAPPSASIPVTCEDQLATWKENATGFVAQIVSMEAAARTLRREYDKVVQERDAAVAKLHAGEAPKEGAPQGAQQ